MTNYTTAAADAQQTLKPLLEVEIKTNQDRLEKLLHKNSLAGMAETAAQVIDNATLPDPEQAARIIDQYCAMVPAHVRRDGRALVCMLESIRKSNVISDSQSSQIALALIVALSGGLVGSLIDWPASPLIELIGSTGITAWARWINPEAIEKADASRERAAADSAHFTVVLDRLKKAHAALELITPEDHKRSTLVLIRNNGQQRLTLHRDIEPVGQGEQVEVKAAQLAVIQQNQNLMARFHSRELEVVA
jgi:hypothetical protein